MKDAWRTHEERMKNAWRTHEERMKNTWRTHEECMKNAWRTQNITDGQTDTHTDRHTDRVTSWAPVGAKNTGVNTWCLIRYHEWQVLGWGDLDRIPGEYFTFCPRLVSPGAHCTCVHLTRGCGDDILVTPLHHQTDSSHHIWYLEIFSHPGHAPHTTQTGIMYTEITCELCLV